MALMNSSLSGCRRASSRVMVSGSDLVTNEVTNAVSIAMGWKSPSNLSVNEATDEYETAAYEYRTELLNLDGVQTLRPERVVRLFASYPGSP